jgi:hypothetical protein
MKQVFCLLLLVIISSATAAELLVNGNFEQELTIGWTNTPLGYYDTLNRATSYNPDPDYEAYAFHAYGGELKMYQSVDIPSTDIQFSAYAKMYAYDNDADTLCWGGASLIVYYKDQAGAVLGQTRIGNYTAPCPWASTPIIHVISVTDSLWHNYAFNIGTELGNLSGVNPLLVKKIEVAVYDTAAHTC